MSEQKDAAVKPEKGSRRREQLRKRQLLLASELAANLHDPKRSAEQREETRRCLLSYLVALNYLPTEEEARAVLSSTIGVNHDDYDHRSPAHRAWSALMDATMPPRKWKARKEREAQPPAPAHDERTNADAEKLADLRAHLECLEFLPENEACRLRLETELYKLEYEDDSEEWPEVINA